MKEQLKLPQHMTEKIIAVLTKYRVKKITIFGSYARGEADLDSDIDVLIKAPEDLSLLDLSAMKREVSKTLGRDVDIIVEGGRNLFGFDNKMFRANIRENGVVIYDEEGGP